MSFVGAKTVCFAPRHDSLPSGQENILSVPQDVFLIKNLISGGSGVITSGSVLAISAIPPG